MSTYGTPYEYDEGMGEADWRSLPLWRQAECFDCSCRFDAKEHDECPACGGDYEDKTSEAL